MCKDCGVMEIAEEAVEQKIFAIEDVTWDMVEVEKRDAKKYKEMREKAKAYFFIENETLMENLENRRNRPYNEYRKMLPGVFKEAGFTEEQVAGVKARWSQYAGCPCGCSPGFILEGLGRGFNIYVTIK